MRLSSLMSRAQVAERLGVTIQWLEVNKTIGPPFYKLSAQTVRYDADDVEAWLKQRKQG